MAKYLIRHLVTADFVAEKVGQNFIFLSPGSERKFKRNSIPYFFVSLTKNANTPP